ncbi:MAG: DMT family transporter [Chitinophaga sp.]|uniref:DMT family transporter n=1 Tax=Chitinophaga sp. TaxID=1869181 RepID=UPI0025C108AD|nr:DMT family transporter [Chitinophaga sp.]MBV8251786.1 DMT family transporter [Chitinophaga sp.]
MKKSFLLLHTAIFLAGFSGIFGKLISLNEVSLVWYRALFSFLFLFPFLKATGRFTKHTLQERLQITISGLLPGLQWVFFYGSIKYANVSVGVICFCTTGFFTALLAPFVTKARLSATELGLSLLTVAGVALVFHFDTSYRLGIILGTISSILGALYMLTNEQLIKRFDAGMINFYQMLGITLGIGLLVPFYQHLMPALHFTPTGTDLIYLVLLASCCTIAVYVMIAESLRKISAFTVNLSFNLEPVYSIILAIFLFNENRELNISFYVGLMLILLSVFLQMRLVHKTR